MPATKDREALAATFERHAEEEGKVLAQYRTLAEKLGDSPLSFLLDQILTEEEMHHLLLLTMAKWLKERPAQTTATIPAADRDALLRLTQTLQKHERETIEACRALKSQLSAQDTGVLDTLLDAMSLDSEKHHRLLTAVENMLRG